ncbi:MAG: CPBP family intramembrane metalloprotease [Candidatus Brocadia sp.]|nr:CPBP family intramembrane metalloprotease [Candidatus Brocadia sp.]
MKSYSHRSKNLANSFLFILPLLVLYEVGIAIEGSNVKNTADVIVKTPLVLFGKNGSLIFNSLVIACLFASVFYIERKYRFSPLIFIPMFLESVVYAIFMGYALGFIVYKILFPYVLASPFSMSMWMGIILSVGAGVYEEIVFRFLLLKSLCFTFTTLLQIHKPIGVMTSIITGALIFTGMHYVGTLGDSFTSDNFTFRLLAGIFLSAVFMFRGLGIAVYTHAIYDVLAVLKPFHV